MSSTLPVQQALYSRLTAVAPGAAIASTLISWPNAPFTPPASGLWYEAHFLPGEPRAAGIGQSAANRHTGLLQVTINAFPNVGEGTANTEAERIIACFKRGTTLTYSGQTVVIDKAWRCPGYESSEPAFYQVPVRIQYRADVAN